MAHTVSPILQETVDATTQAVGAMDSATAMINGFQVQLATAIDKALENGATADELAPIQAVLDALKASRDALVAAMAANPTAGPAKR